MLIAPPFGLLARGRAASKDLSAFADLLILQEKKKKVKDFFAEIPVFS